jgi:DNA-binding PadR family transcriptional regulator
MDLIVLGLLVIRALTIYELSTTIERLFSQVSSNSMGSLQAALKRMLDKGFLEVTEYTEGGVLKKRYAATDAGRAHFAEAINRPMRPKDRNMELAKLFFMGFAPAAERAGLIESYLAELEEGRVRLTALKAAIDGAEEDFVASYLAELKASGGLKAFKQMIGMTPVEEAIAQIGRFQFASLDYTLAKLDFEIGWFTRLRDEVSE